MTRTRGFWVGLSCVAALALGCSAESDGSGSSGTRTPGGNTFGNADPADPGGSGPGTGSNSTGSSNFGNSNGTTADPNATPVGTPPETTVESSFIWIANSAQGTVSKIDTRTMTELGRYLTSPNGTGLPSRTSVAEDGNVAVANRGGATGQLPGDGGGVSKFFANAADCSDKNGNGVIDTSTGANDILPWDQEECRAWHTTINEWSNRPVQWAPAPAPDAPANVWTAGATTCNAMSCSFNVYRLDGITGAILDTVPITGLTGIDFIMAGGVSANTDPLTGLVFGLLPVIENYGPYGGVSDGRGNFWVFVANTTHLVRIDATTLEVRMWSVPMGNGYGITIDGSGRIFICGKLGVARFTPETQTWDTNYGTVDMGYNGCMTDGANTLWVGSGSDEGSAGLFAFDTETLNTGVWIGTDQMGRPMQVKGVSVDVDGNVWGVSSPGATGMGPGNIAWRFNPVTMEVATYEGLTGAYSYSDMTGFGLTSAGYSEPPLE